MTTPPEPKRDPRPSVVDSGRRCPWCGKKMIREVVDTPNGPGTIESCWNCDVPPYGRAL